ncbi:uncharacterized protein LOC110186099 [Drosophila serrata]|uniref:uncharacterized protein LOC110186099 n=1 Tax=Drosophila serrata TaxID=7274 RepID=UPI000A1D3732|nr:uncharacterized protein LOC110186099 [Drosophila serrata]
MSYLLTEIALEMLGYKFYDTNGVFHLTNFQNNSTQLESHPDEPSLTEFIEQAESLDEDLDGGAAASKEVNLPTELSRSTASNPPNVADVTHCRRAPAKALAKIMDYESDKIAAQITNRLEKEISRLGAYDNEIMLEQCIHEEKRLICEDADAMQKFREFLQIHLQQIDNRPFEKYERTFGTD